MHTVLYFLRPIPTRERLVGEAMWRGSPLDYRNSLLHNDPIGCQRQSRDVRTSNRPLNVIMLWLTGLTGSVQGTEFTGG